MRSPVTSILRKKVLIESRADTPDQAGGYTPSWSPFHTAFAEVSPLSADEVLFAQRIMGKTTHKITIRYKRGISNTMRVRFNSGDRDRIFAIQSVINYQERNRFITLLCEEEASTS